MSRLLLALLVALTLVLPSVAAAGRTQSDPRGDQTTYTAIFLGSGACKDPATDLTHLEIVGAGGNLYVNLTVADISGRLSCTVVPVGPEAITTRVFFQNQFGWGPSLVVYREVTYDFGGGKTTKQCFIVQVVQATERCGGTVAGNTIQWVVPIGEFKIQGACYETVFAQGLAQPRVEFGHLALAVTDFIDTARWLCP
ncbi:MAG TPA: hypothetical protein VNZ52_09435 [Candidatus Thermoplasmatota archaeon]|nr:hypothetical protein [Candidatus Thermoplasmatota archaeon]